jgi:hypothetical protein
VQGTDVIDGVSVRFSAEVREYYGLVHPGRETVSLLWLLLSLRPRRFLSPLRHPCIIFRRAGPRRCICRQAAYRVRYKIADMHATARRQR